MIPNSIEYIFRGFAYFHVINTLNMIISELVSIIMERPLETIGYFAMLLGFFEIVRRISNWVQIKTKSALVTKVASYSLWFVAIAMFLVIFDRAYPLV